MHAVFTPFKITRGVKERFVGNYLSRGERKIVSRKREERKIELLYIDIHIYHVILSDSQGICDFIFIPPSFLSFSLTH